MKKLFLGSAVLAALVAGPAMAADIPVKAPPVYKPACANFGGFYVGAQVGAARYGHHWEDRDAWAASLFSLATESTNTNGSISDTTEPIPACRL